MADRISKKARSRNMAQIKSKNTKPELLVRRYLHSRGFRFRLHPKELPGRPDIVLPRYRTAIFVHGCFWHAHDGCLKAYKPTSNTEYWSAKLSANAARDELNARDLEKIGWKVITVWECDLAKTNSDATLSALVDSVRSAGTGDQATRSEI